MAAPSTPAATDEVVIPIIEERLRVGRREVETGRVRVDIKNDHHDVLVDEALLRGSVTVERVAIDRHVDSVPDIQDDGTTIIIPVVEEVLVVEKRLILREEIHIHRSARVDQHQETVRLTHQRAIVTRVEPDTTPSPTPEKEV
ncbi:hypothetical protein GCM10007973_07780 [Polymorphobacter multimanifer]|uniref:DUF2382 domain-containing protein n=1 Tax=Polymorphobacter multimanifer TaxID=1070431 RepID=UPI00166A7F89|nr:DUF2382 domain-containing protein [Polymorphobacter multimanifer]GGI73271.1 hypothetical protein GCM10007973_07780 [Polymorphobacter multimanifer]